MNLSKRSRPSPALVLAALALVFAVVGTAVAGPEALTRAVSKSNVKKIATKQIKKRLPWGTEDIANGAVTSGKLADGALSVVMRQGPTETVSPGGFSPAEASCREGERATGGGVYNESSVFSLKVTSSYPTPNPATPPPTGTGRSRPAGVSGWRTTGRGTANL